MQLLPLQNIEATGPFEGDAMAWVLGHVVAATGGEAMLGLLTGSVIFVTMYIASEGDMATPTVALVLTGTVLVGMAPPSYGDIGAAVVAMGLAAGVWQVLQKYVLARGVR